VSRFTFTKAPAPELPGKLKAMQAAGRSDIELVLGGLDILSAGIEQGLLTQILPAHAAKFPDAMEAACGIRPPLPDWLADLHVRPERVTLLPNDQMQVEHHILSTSRATREGAAA